MNAIEFENVSKQYRLGLVGTGTLAHDLRRFWLTGILRREDPYLKIGETNDRASKGNSDYVWALRDITFNVEKAFCEFLSKYGQEMKKEFYIPTLVNDLIVAGKATCQVLDTTAKWFGVTYSEDRPQVVAKIAALIAEGVYPAKLF